MTIHAAIDWDGELSQATINLDYDPDQLDGDLRIGAVEPSEDVTRVDHFISLSYPLIERDGAEVGVPSGSVAGGAEQQGDGWVGYFAFVVARFGDVDTGDD